MEENRNETVIGKLAQKYQQLYLDPDTDDIEAFKNVVLKGMAPEKNDLSGYICDSRDREVIVDTPSGTVYVATIYNRGDFERIIRCMMAAKEGPENPVPSSQGAATLEVFNWANIKEHRAKFLADALLNGNLDADWDAEWKRFTSVRDNYVDQLIILSVGPYSGIAAEEAGCTEAEWLELSDTIRKYHELTHVICRRLYPAQIQAVWDELTADAIGLYAAYGHYDPELEKKFLGIQGEQYVGGRLENYVDDPEAICAKVCMTIAEQARIIQEHAGVPVFSMIDILEENQERLGFGVKS